MLTYQLKMKGSQQMPHQLMRRWSLEVTSLLQHQATDKLAAYLAKRHLQRSFVLPLQQVCSICFQLISRP
jgi:hypothetical protein